MDSSSSSSSSSKLISFLKTIGSITHHHSKADSSAAGHTTDDDHDHHHAKTKHRKGVVAMYVGKELKRYEVPVDYLNLFMVQELLKLSQEGEEFDYIIDGAIKLPCITTEVFDQVLLECARAKGSN